MLPYHEPPKSVVVIAPVAELSEQFAKDAFSKTSVVSVNSTPSPVAATVATAPEKFPAIVPKEPAVVVQTGASDTLKLPSYFEPRVLYLILF